MRATRVSLYVLVSVFLLLLLIPPSIASAETLQPGFDQIASPLGSTVTTCWALGMADFNNDGVEDIIGGNTMGDVYLFKGSGNATFTAGVRQVNAPYWDSCLGFAVGDFNGDGKQDFVGARTGGSSVVASDGVLYLFLGNGDGTFQKYGAAGFEQGLPIGDGGTDVMTLAAADVDGDGRLDLVSSDAINSGDNSRADILLWRNLGNDASGKPIWAAPSTISSMPSQTINPEQAPYYPPKAWGKYPTGYGLAFGDVDGDGHPDLLVTDIASYLYVFHNDGAGNFALVRYDNISTGTRPYAYARLHEIITNSRLPIAVHDFNGDGRPDFAVGGSDGAWDGAIDVWLNNGNDSTGRATFVGAGKVGGITGSPAMLQGLATGQLNPNQDSSPDIIFGGWSSQVYGLKSDITDTDGDGIIDRVDNLPTIPNFPRIDMNGDGTLNHFDQIDLDGDGVGSVMVRSTTNPLTYDLLGDPDADGDGVPNEIDNLPFVPNPLQTDQDGDGIGEITPPLKPSSFGDPLDNRDPDGDGVPNGPFDASLTAAYKDAKRKLMLGDTPFVIRIDALGRWWQSEFTQTLADSVFMDPATFAAKYPKNWDGTWGGPSGVTPPGASLVGGKSLPVSVMLIPKMVWTDPTVVSYLSDRLQDPLFELGQHGTYHAAIQPAGQPSSEMNGYDPLEMFAYMRVGQQTMLGQYDSTPDYLSATTGSPAIDWTGAASRLISFAPPYDEYDVNSVQAVAQLGYLGFSADIWIAGEPRTLMPALSDTFDQFGMLHADATFMPYADPHGAPDYDTYIRNNITAGKPNILLIEEVNFSGADAQGAVDNTVDPAKWAAFQQLLDIVKSYPGATFLTQGEYAMARAYDNAPGIYNPDQADTDHDGVGDVAQTSLAASGAAAVDGATTLKARLVTTFGGSPLAGKTVAFTIDANGDGTYDAATEPHGTAVTDATGWATLPLTFDLPAGDLAFKASFEAADGYVTSSDTAALTARLSTSMSAQGYAGNAGDTVTFRARLTDSSAGPIEGKTLTFTVDENGDGTYAATEPHLTATTGTDGWASVSSAVSLSVERSTYRATFDGDATFAAPSPAFADITLLFGTTLSAQDATAVAGQSVSLRARLTKLGSPVVGKTLTFAVSGGPPATAVTGTDGWATCTVTLTLPAQVTSFRATFPGDSDYGPGNPATGVLVVRHETSVLAVDGATRATPPGMISPKGCFAATLRDAYTNAPLAGQIVSFYGYRTATSAQLVGSTTTNASGVAWIALPKGAGSLLKYQARYAGTQIYLAAADDGTINGNTKK